MKTAYALLGFLFLAIVAGGLYLSSKGGEPETQDTSSVINQANIIMSSMELTSTTFEHNGAIPSKYTCDGDNVNPPLEIHNVPEGTQSLVLLMDDPDIPDVFKQQRDIDDFDHWALVNIMPSVATIPENAVPQGSIVGVNSAGSPAYTGPCPPAEYKPTEHRYIFRLYALDTELAVPQGVTQDEIKEEMTGHIIEQAELIGRYDRAQ